MSATSTSPLELAGYDVDVVRRDFPILSRRFGGRPLAYLDSANTSQKPQQVIDAISDHYAQHNANVARAMHSLGAEASEAYEDARDKVAAFIGAGNRDEVVITEMEHHSNIVPWQLLCERTGATLRWFALTDEGRLDLSDLDSLINERTKVVSLAWVSNMLGTINPVSTVVARAHEVGALVVVDASQAVPQLPVDVSALGADFVAFTGHKMVGPTGIGVLWGRYDLLAALPPFLGGGEMIETVTMARSTFAPPPARFEAGTPPIAQAVGLGAAVDYLSGLGMDAVAAHEQRITAYALDQLAGVRGLTVLGPQQMVDRGGAISFELDGVHPHDVAQVLDSRGVAVRAGHHCAKPAHQRFGVQSSTRASFYLYTTEQEVDALVEALDATRSYFKVG